MTRCIVIVLDSGGIGASSDVATFADTARTNASGNVDTCFGGTSPSNFEARGSAWRAGVRSVVVTAGPPALVARHGIIAKCNDTAAGHLGTAGIHTNVPFPTNRDGFPPAIAGGRPAHVARRRARPGGSDKRVLGKALHTVTGSAGTSSVCIGHNDEAMERTFEYSDFTVPGFIVVTSHHLANRRAPRQGVLSRGALLARRQHGPLLEGPRGANTFAISPGGRAGDRAAARR